jgi:hypothetical protein
MLLMTELTSNPDEELQPCASQSSTDDDLWQDLAGCAEAHQTLDT